MFSSYLQQKKELILQALSAYIASQKNQDVGINEWKLDALDRIEAFMQNGKMIRGTLVYLGATIAEAKDTEDLANLALAMEFFQTGLLMHDDIIDNATARRGKPTLHTTYTELMNKKQSRYPKNTGTSLAILTGDIAFFLGMQLLTKLQNQSLATFCTKELQTVSYAQMLDVALGASNRPAKSINDILKMYQNKTGRYSILLPLTIGAMMGKANAQTLKHIAKSSEALGIAFQLVDDSLDIFGNEQITGKTIGTDIQEGKQTPYIHFLRALGDETITQHIQELFNKGTITPEDMVWVKQKIKKTGIDKKIVAMISEYKTQAIEAITRIPMKNETQKLTLSFVEYLTNRIQ